MGSNNKFETVSNIYLTVTSEYIYGEGESEDSVAAACYDEVNNRNLPKIHYTNTCAGGDTIIDNCKNDNTYESLKRKKKHCLRNLINNTGFLTASEQPSKLQKLKRVLFVYSKPHFIFRHRGKICLILFLFCIIQFAVVYYKTKCVAVVFFAPFEKIKITTQPFEHTKNTTQPFEHTKNTTQPFEHTKDTTQPFEHKKNTTQPGYQSTFSGCLQSTEPDSSDCGLY